MRFPTGIVTAALILALLGGGIFWRWRDSVTPDKNDTLARCIGEKGLKLYGTYWCPACQGQKKTFGKSAKYLPYVECAETGKNEMAAVCQDAGVKNFPTWIGPGEEKTEGALSVSDLAARSGCPLP